MSVQCVVTGASSQLGAPVLARLAARGHTISAWTRTPPTPTGQNKPALNSAIQWQQADLQHPPALADGTQLLVHLAPIDLLPGLLATATQPGLRIIAISTCSIRYKAQSASAEEQQLAAQLLAAEQRVEQLAEQHGQLLTVLRPSMLYGAGRDGTLAVLQSFVQRFGFLVLPAQATGLRQPVHVDDVAQAIVACIEQPVSIGRCYELGGADQLSLRNMAEQVFTDNGRRPRILAVPHWLLRSLIAVVRWSKLRADWRPGLVARAQQAQVADNGPAQRDFAYAPRRFSGAFIKGDSDGC